MEKNKNAFNKFLNSRSLKYGSNSVILIAAVVVIAILVNVLVGLADVKLDLTSNKLFSLSDVTKSTLKDLKTDVRIIGLFDDGKIGSGDQYKQVTDILGLYEKNSHIKVEYIDPDKNPGIIKQLDDQDTMDLQKSDFIVMSTVNGKEKKKKLDYYDLFQTQVDQQSFQQYLTGSNAEQGFTGAIRYVTSEKTPVVYFLEGHGEIDVNSDLTNIKQIIERNNYVVNGINLTTAGKLPEDAEILVVTSPKSDLSISERDTIAAFLKNGGKAVFLFDYLPSDPNLDNFNALLSTYNVAVDYDKVKENDSNRHLPDDQYTILLDVNSSSIIPQASNVVLQNSRSVSILKNTKEYITTTSLMKTSGQAVGEAASSGRGDAIQGPLDVAVAVENKGNQNPSKVIVMGNASFISDSAERQYASYYQYGAVFFLMSLNWMFDAKDEVVAPTKSYDTQQINVSQLQSSMLGIFVILILPLIILGTGLFVFMRRRHL